MRLAIAAAALCTVLSLACTGTAGGAGGGNASGGGSATGGGSAIGGGSATGGGTATGGGAATGGGGSATGGGTATDGGSATGGGASSGGGSATGGGAATGGGSGTGGGSTDGGMYFVPNPAISIGAMITASTSTASTANLAFDGRVDTGAWTGSPPAADGTVSDMWVTVKLGTGTPCVAPNAVLLVWHSLGDPDYTIDVAVNYDTPTGYTVEVSPDAQQWTKLVDVSSATVTYRARSHRLDFTGQCYLRFTVTQLKTGQGQRTPQIDELYVYDVSKGNDDTWIFLGDGPNRFAYDQHFAGASFTDAVHSAHPKYNPAMLDAAELNGSVSAMKTALPSLLTMHPGIDKWVLALGLDEAGIDTPANTQFVTDMQGLIDQVQAAGHHALIPHLRYTSTNNYPHLAAYNTAIDQLVQTNHLLPAPDLYALFQGMPSLLCSSTSDCESNWIGISPADPAGYQAENAAWAQALDAYYAP